MPRWLAQCAFNVILLLIGRICAAQGPSPSLQPWSPPLPRPSPSLVVPLQVISLYYLDFITQAALCSRVADIGCMGEDLQWLIDLEPFPLTTGTSGSPSTDLYCIGNNDTGCKWRTIQDYKAASGSDTHAYIPLELTIRAKNITRMFMLGHAIWTVDQYSVAASYIMRQLSALTITCTQAVPVFAPYVLEPLIMALSGAVMDFGWNTTTGAGATTTVPRAGSSSSSSSSSNTTSDASTKTPPATFSRLYSPPTNWSSPLRSLSIQDCGLTGQLPPASFWLQLPSLEHLDLSRNQLSGPLPATFGPSPPLSYLNLSYNRISGPLTASMARYGGCGRILDLSYNDLRGKLPDAWLSNACSLRGKSQFRLEAWLRRRQLFEEGEHESGPDGGVAKVVSSPVLSYRATKPLTAVTEGTTPSSSSTMTETATTGTSNSYAFWLSYPMSYMYGTDNCPLFGVAWRQSVAARVISGGVPFNFTVLLYGNPHLSTPGGSGAGYAAAASEWLQFQIRDNACTIFDPLPGLLWVWCTFGGTALAVLIAALVQLLYAVRGARMGVRPDRHAASKRSREKGPNVKAHVMPAAAGSRAVTVPVSCDAPAPPGKAEAATSGADGGGGGRSVTGDMVAKREAVVAAAGNQLAPGYGDQPSNGDNGADCGVNKGERQRVAYCGHIRQCGTYLYVIPPSLSAISIGLTVFLMKAMRELARSMASRVAAVNPDSRPQTASGNSTAAKEVGRSLAKGVESAAQPGGADEEKLEQTKASSNDGEATEPRMTPSTPVKAPRLPEWSTGQSWVSGLQPGRSGLSSPALAEPQAGSVARTETMPLFEACALPVSAPMSGTTSASSRSSSKRVAPTAFSQAPALAAGIVSGGGGGDSSGGSGTPVRPLLCLQGSGGGPVAESLAPVEADLEDVVSAAAVAAAAVAAAAGAATATGQADGRRGRVPARLYGKNAKAAAVGAPGRLLPASPYGAPHQCAHGLEAAAGTRARASLHNTFVLSRSGSRSGGCGFSPGVVHDAGKWGCGSPGGGLESLAEVMAGTTAAGHVGGTPRPGTEADATDGECAGQGRVRFSLPNPVQLRDAGPSQPHGLVGTLTWQEPKSPSSCRAVGESIEADGSNPCSSISSYTEVRDSGMATAAGGGGGGGGSARAGVGSSEGPDRMPLTASARRSSLRPSPTAAYHSGVSTLGSSTATSTPSVLPPGSLPGASTDIGFNGSESSMQFITKEQMRGGRPLVSSASTSNRGSRKLRVVVEFNTPSNANWCNDPDLPGHMGTPTAMQQVPTPSSVSQVPESSTPKHGATWLEDRLAALATLSTTAPVPAPVTAAGCGRMPSVAAAAAVAAAKTRKRSGGTAAGADRNHPAQPGGTPGGGGISHLQPEALQMVNQYLRDYAFGKKGSGWVACVGRALLSVVAVLLIFAPLAPLAAAAALLAALIIIIHSIYARITGYNRVSGGAIPSSASRFDQLAKSLRLSGNLVLTLHTHVAAWVICMPLGVLTGVLYGLGYMWGKDSVPMPWVWLGCNSACLAGVLLVLIELALQMRTWEKGVCSYPYAMVLQAATAASVAVSTAGAAATGQGDRNTSAADSAGSGIANGTSHNRQGEVS
ncbi:hypothetical protein Vretimale_11926 [Volvox reticuliferus]|uniref:GP46-like surface antigen n=1 Tax=Volvox reticuliferus TaxID=1737510 RepID=A0A8J4GIR6_9CHLO|nr:hypothetical protein Vretimale_11926 [Volvox reticuliferus]